MISTQSMPVDAAAGVYHRRVLTARLEDVGERVAQDVVAVEDGPASVSGVLGHGRLGEVRSESQPSGRRSESTSSA